ncbi:MAG: CPBP family intramembrane metalloprotease [Oscillospiraceae bacterium]|nr:CPBP family intramembrane metalloprotease [Oscillospiraceae bacterium]
MVLILIISLIIRAAGLSGKISEDWNYGITYGVQAFVVLPLTMLLAKRFGDPCRPAEHKMNIGQIILAYFCCETLAVAGNMIGTTFNGILSRIVGFDTSFKQLEESLMGDAGITFMLCAVLIAPLTEELVFRKILIDNTRKYGDFTAIMLSGAMFGLMHGNFTQFFYTMALGCFLAFLYIKTGRVRYTITLHVMMNTVGTIVPLLLRKYLTGLNEWAESLAKSLEQMNLAETLRLLISKYPLLIYSGITWAFVITGLVLLLVFRRRFTLEPAIAPIPKNQRLKTVCLNPGFLLFFAFCIYRFVRLMIA